MSPPHQPRDVRGRREDRDRGLSRITRATVAGGAGALLATGVLAGWLSTPARAHPGSTSTTSTSSGTSSSPSSSSTGEQDDGGLQSPTESPGSASTDSGSQQPPVVSGGS
jgi:hypothetical protein